MSYFLAIQIQIELDSNSNKCNTNEIDLSSISGIYYSQVYTTCENDEKYTVTPSWNDLYQEYVVTEKKVKGRRWN